MNLKKRKSRFKKLYRYFQAFRAPTDNDKSFGNWLAKDWKNQRLDAPQVEVITPETETQETNSTDGRARIFQSRTKSFPCNGLYPFRQKGNC